MFVKQKNFHLPAALSSPPGFTKFPKYLDDSHGLIHSFSGYNAAVFISPLERTLRTKRAEKRPNILIFLVNEECYPPVYEDEELRRWPKMNLKAQEMLREHGLEFHCHDAGATACSPSRATIFTGQCPSLYGVT